MVWIALLGGRLFENEKEYGGFFAFGFLNAIN
jgi:hypothetical protein